MLAECAQETWQQDAIVASVFFALFATVGFICWIAARTR
jgi:hypothetical protein